MKHQLFYLLIIPLLISCGTAGNSNSEKSETPISNEQVGEEIIINRIEQVYKGQLTDQQIMSAQFYSVFHRAQEQSQDETGWPDWDYWRCTQGDDPEMSITNVEVYEGDRATVSIDLKFPDYIVKVELPMVYENDDWFVDDIITHKDGDTWSLKEVAQSLIN